MSKLDGNERWQSKMLTPEFVEAYDNRHQQPQAGPLSPEQLTMIKDAVLLPHLQTMVAKAIQDMEKSPGLLQRLYRTVAREIMERVSRDLYAAKRELARAGIKLQGEEQGEGGYYFKYTSRGEPGQIGMTRDAMRVEINNRLGVYVADLTAKLEAADIRQYKQPVT